ncbi:MAG: type VI secretion system contractile sheath large subunit [Candidatus Poribacteria bacterium]
MAGIDEQKEAQQEVTTEEESSLLDAILAETKIKPSDEGYNIARQGVAAFISELLKPTRDGAKVQQAVVTEMISEIDKKLSAQVDEIIHNSEYQKLESAWRGLKLVVDRTDFRQNIKIEVLNVSKEDLLNDFEDSPEVTKSGLYKTVYSEQLGTLGGQPYGAMIGNYDFGPGPQDVKLLQYVASVAAMSHCPFMAAAGPQFFGLDDFRKLPNLKDLSSIFEGPQYIKWNSFKQSEDSRYVGLTMPRFLLRLPYSPDSNPVKAFEYRENVSDGHEQYLWGNTAYAFATRLTESFASNGWCPNIIGPQGGGAMKDLYMHQFESMGEIDTKIPTEISITDRKELELAEQGFISLVYRKGSDNAVFFSANSPQKPKLYGDTAEGKALETNYRLGTQLPYVFVVSRLAHYIKVMQRENLGSFKQRNELERELNDWIRQYVSDTDTPMPGVRQRRPLRRAVITVEDVEGEAGWYKVGMKVQPHMKYMGAFFELSLVGKLDKTK